MPAENKACAAHLQFPFKSRSILQCDNYIKEEDDVGQSMKDIKQFTGHVGYGRRAPAPAWHTEDAAYPKVPAKNDNVRQCENYIKDGHGMDQFLERDMEYFMDDPRRGAHSFSDSNILF